MPQRDHTATHQNFGSSPDWLAAWPDDALEASVPEALGPFRDAVREGAGTCTGCARRPAPSLY